MEDEQFKALVKHLDTVTTRLDAMLKLLALGLPKELTGHQKIVMLRETGLTVGEVAEILGTSPGYVSVALDRARRKKQKASATPEPEPHP